MAETELRWVRTLVVGNVGADVAAVQLMLHNFTRDNPKSNLRPYGIKPDPLHHKGFYGQATAGQMDHLRKMHNAAHPRNVIPPSGGMFGPRMHAILSKWAGPDAIKLMQEEWDKRHPQPTTTEARDMAADAMRWWYGHRRGFSIYSGPGHRTIGLREDGIQNRRLPPDVPHFSDCSAGCQWALWVASRRFPKMVIDPGANRWGWDATGNMVTHGSFVRASNCKIGDLVYYGSSVGYTVHVSMVVDFVRGVPWTIGFGHQGGPRFNPYTYHSYPVVAIKSYFRD